MVFLLLLDPLLGIIINEQEGPSRQINFIENNPNSFIKLNPSPEDKNQAPVIKRTDKYGFILGPNERSEDKIDIIFLGASNVESENVQEKYRFPYLAVELLNDSLGKEFVSRNAGVGGNLLSASNVALTAKIVNLQPDFVVLSSSLIDLLYLSKNESYWTGSKKYLVTRQPINSLLKGIKNLFFPNIWLQLRKYVIQADNSDFLKSRYSPRDMERILGAYEKQLEIFLQTCFIYNIRPILSTDYHVPSVVKKNLLNKEIFSAEEADFYINKLVPALNGLIISKAEKYDIPVIKLNELIEQKENFVNSEDGVHLTDKGSKRVSEVISNILASIITHEDI